MYNWNVIIRIYFLYAEDFHMSICWICASKGPDNAAIVAAPAKSDGNGTLLKVLCDELSSNFGTIHEWK